jgi:hypothetical protein
MGHHLGGGPAYRPGRRSPAARLIFVALSLRIGHHNVDRRVSLTQLPEAAARSVIARTPQYKVAASENKHPLRAAPRMIAH